MKRTVLILSALLFTLALYFVFRTPGTDNPKQVASVASADPADPGERDSDPASESQATHEIGASGSAQATGFMSNPSDQQTIPSTSVGKGESIAVPSNEEAAASKEAVLAMNSMIMAHASLRAPEETDPDSKGNKEIMQVMIMKALNHRTETTPEAQK